MLTRQNSEGFFWYVHTDSGSFGLDRGMEDGAYVLSAVWSHPMSVWLDLYLFLSLRSLKPFSCLSCSSTLPAWHLWSGGALYPGRGPLLAPALPLEDGLVYSV